MNLWFSLISRKGCCEVLCGSVVSDAETSVRVVKEVAEDGREWIDELVILEAKALEFFEHEHTGDSRPFKLANQSFFGKYFKHYTGMSPKEYRKADSSLN